MTLFYTQEESNRQKKRMQLSLYLCCGLLAAALIACIILCCCVTTANARRLLFWTIGIFTIAGWIAICIGSVIYAPSRAIYLHIQGLEAEESREIAGTVVSVSPPFRIPRSITACKVKLNTADGTQTLSILAPKASLLPTGVPLLLTVARSYITAFEVQHEDR